ncbi:hypothetical protein U1Q18_019861 [Sarracenia purpurea var. burkii]
MGNGKNRSGLIDGTNASAFASAAAAEKAASIEECDVGLGLRMQRTESFPSTRMMAMQHPPHHHHHHRHPSSENMGGVGFSGEGGSGGGCGPIYCNLSNQVACLSDRYDVLGAASASGGSLVVPRTFLPFTSDSSFKSSGGNMAAAPARVPFTASQWQELERQTKIYKYMVASMPVPPQLLIPISTTPSTTLPTASQSNTSGVDLSFSRSSDSEPWRCRRTDGKKWRCSRDVAPNQKYCERHAHKSRPRSRKPVELPASHNIDTNNRSNTVVDSNLNVHPLVDLPANAAAQAFQKPIFHIPTVVSDATYGQPRYTEWFMKEDPIPGSTLNQQWQQLMQSSSSGGLKRYNEDSYRNRSVLPQHYEEQVSMDTNLYFDMQNRQPNDQSWSSPCPKLACLQGGSNTDQRQTTRRFIDSLSSAERERIDGFSHKYSVSSTREIPLSSLTLSMSGGNGIDQQSENAQMGLGMMDPERESGGSFKSHWLNPIPWMGSPPGGPLGEALCLGLANTAKAASNVASPHGYSTSNSTTTSSCSKSSCEDSGRGLH